MGVGLGLLLLAAGLVLALVLGDQWSYDLTTVGWILTAVGALGIIVALIMNRQRARTTTTVVERRDPPLDRGL
jgi:hypothetical protein